MYKKIHSYFKTHPVYNSGVHMLIGVGLGALLTYPYFGTHPVRWGLALIVVGILAHLYPLTIKKSSK